MEKSKEYAKNTIILLFGKFATQFISFFLLPLYTHFLLTDDYGLVDLYQTYIGIFVPVILLCLDSAVFRFLIDERNDDEKKSKTITNVFLKTIKQMIIFVAISIFICLFVDIKYNIFIILNVIAVMFSNVMLQICRGIGKNLNYSIACIITGLITLLINVILIIICKFGASSILIASFVANIICSIYILISTKTYKYIKFKFKNKEKMKEMLSYSLPLIPNALSWWIINASDRTIISVIINTSTNGIYTVSCKFSNLLNSIFAVFSMSWQETASIHINDKDRDEFFSKMINSIYNLFVSMSVLIIIVVSLSFEFIIGENYLDAYNYIPILLLANTFSILIGLFGGIYIAKKMTKRVTTTTMYAAILNLLINISLIYWLGLYAVCISTLLSYMIMAIYRYIDIKKFIKIKISTETIIGNIFLFLIAFCGYYLRNTIFSIVIFFVIIICSMYMNRKILKLVLNRFKIRINKTTEN